MELVVCQIQDRTSCMLLWGTEKREQECIICFCLEHQIKCFSKIEMENIRKEHILGVDRIIKRY